MQDDALVQADPSTVGDAALSRRSLLAGLGGLGGIGIGISGAATAWPATAGATDTGGFGPETATTIGAAVAMVSSAGSALKPGYSYKMLHATDFFPRAFASGRSYTQAGGFTGAVMPSLAGPQDFAASIDLPHGSVLKEVEFYYSVDAASSVSTGVVRFGPEANTADDLVFEASSPGAAGRFFATKLVDSTIDTHRYRHVALFRFSGTAGTQRLEGARIGYVAAPSGFQPVSPQQRVFDTRNGLGKLTAGTERIVSLAPYVPATAKGALVNLTVTATEGSGFLAAFPADTAWPTTSSVNWFDSGQTLANAAITAVDGSSQIKLYCGAGAAAAIVDVLGWFA
ncbi:MAG: hypothetical protein AB7L13_02455 [Acidimicrobiia bacterium]